MAISGDADNRTKYSNPPISTRNPNSNPPLSPPPAYRSIAYPAQAHHDAGPTPQSYYHLPQGASVREGGVRGAEYYAPGAERGRNYNTRGYQPQPVYVLVQMPPPAARGYNQHPGYGMRSGPGGGVGGPGGPAERSGTAAGCCAGFLAVLMCCCCMDLMF